MKTKILAVLIVLGMLVVVMPPMQTLASTPNIVLGSSKAIHFDVKPAETQL
jgi:hypothetical protein